MTFATGIDEDEDEDMDEDVDEDVDEARSFMTASAAVALSRGTRRLRV